MDMRVLVASEVRLYRDALQSVLRGAEGIVQVGIACSAEEVVGHVPVLVPSVVVFDMAMAENFHLAKPISNAPQVDGVVILRIPEIPVDVIACQPSAILGYVSRDGTVAVLLDAIRAAGRGNPAQETEAGNIDELTAREMEILRLMQQGVSNKTISRSLGIELSTVKNHVHSILGKLGVHRRGEAISLLYAHEMAARGWDVLPHADRPDDEGDDLPPEALLA